MLGPTACRWKKKQAGNAIEVFYPEDDTILITSPIAVMKDAPHPNAARLFMNFFYSKQYSEVMVKTFNFPLRADVGSANGIRLDRLHFYRSKVERLATGIPEVVAKWRETFGV